jgi:hypothetical protein
MRNIDICFTLNLPKYLVAYKNPTSHLRNGVSKTPSHDLPPEQEGWRAYFYGDDNRIGGIVNIEKRGKPDRIQTAIPATRAEITDTD